MYDISSVLFDAVYNDPLIGCDAEIDVLNFSPGPVLLRAIDKTDGAIIMERGGRGSLGLQTIKPVAVVKARDLWSAGLTPAELDGGTITLRSDLSDPDGKTWRIESHQIQPAPRGELAGEVMLILIETH